MTNFRRFSFLLLTSLALLTTACGGGSSSSSEGSNAETDEGNTESPQYTVSVQTSGGGQAEPGQQQVEEGERARITLVPHSGFRLLSASGCGGSLEGNEYLTGPVQENCWVSVDFGAFGSVAGQLLPAPDTTVDRTLNDKLAAVGDNTDCAAAQNIDNRVTLHGFASAVATDGDAEQEHYAESSNPRDFYRVSLNAGQVIELQVADHESGGDLDLYLWNSDCSRRIDASTEGGSVEQVASILGGESVVEVRAEAGISKYVMRVTTAWSSDYDADALEALSGSIPAFRIGEVILTFDATAGAEPQQALSEALQSAQGLQLRFRHEQTDRATLAFIEPSTDPIHLPGPLPGALEELKDAGSTEAYEVLNTLRSIDFLARQPGVRFAEPNYLMGTQRMPDDPRYGDQWHYEQIHLPEAWESTIGESTDGQSVIVAIADTGVYLGHEDLNGKLVTGWDFHDDDNDPDDHNSESTSRWHGTHVAGTASSSTNNSIGAAGVSWAAKIMPVRVLGDESGSRYDVMQGVRYAAGMTNDSGTLPERPASVLNLSLGGGGHSGSEQSLYNDVRQSGVLVVAAAGNENSDQPMYPAAYDGVVSVSATNCQNERASYSNYGSTISLAAPGGDSNSCTFLGNGRVLSAVGSGNDDSRSSDYAWLMGTSMASPHVAGVMALMRAVYPDLSPKNFEMLLADGDITDDLGEAGRDDEFGYGLINARKAVEAAQVLADGNAEWSARVVAEPSTLFLGHESEASLELRQEGDGEAPAVTGGNGQADWLSVVGENVDARGLGTYRAEVDRSVFGEGDSGNYESELVFTLEDNSEVRVRVHIQVGFASQAAPVYVLLLEPETREPLYDTVAQWTSSGELRYRIEGIVPGDYLLVAGSDVDVDGIICQPGEICGAYPKADEKEVISVPDGHLGDLDFPMDILSRFRSFGDQDSAVSRR